MFPLTLFSSIDVYYLCLLVQLMPPNVFLFWYAYCLCKTKWEIIMWKILIRLLFWLSSCSIKNPWSIHHWILWNKHTWDGADSESKMKSSEYSICKQQGNIMSEREHCVCIEARGAGELNRKVSITTCRKISCCNSSHSRLWVSVREGQAATWAAIKDKEVERTKNTRG